MDHDYLVVYQAISIQLAEKLMYVTYKIFLIKKLWFPICILKLITILELNNKNNQNVDTTHTHNSVTYTNYKLDKINQRTP